MSGRPRYDLRQIERSEMRGPHGSCASLRSWGMMVYRNAEFWKVKYRTTVIKMKMSFGMGKTKQ